MNDASPAPANSQSPTPSKLPSRRPWLKWSNSLLLIPSAFGGGLLLMTLRHKELNEVFFVNSAYYVMTAMLAVYLCVLLSGIASWRSIWHWCTEHRVGLLTATLVSLVALLTVEPAYRVLADEANLVGVSRNLFYERTANFPIAGKWYFENFWTLGLATDRRPALFPYLVSLLHFVRGYHPENAFHLNAILFVAFVFTAYRIARSLGGELFGAATAILVATNPNTLVAARSAGFDLLSTLMLLIVFKGFIEYSMDMTSRRLALLALQLCMLAHVRYEGWGLALATLAVLVTCRMVRREHLRGYAYLYAFLPLFLLPRYWQMIAKAHDAEQPLSASLFTFSNFVQNGGEYIRLLKHPLDISGPHSPLLMLLGLAGCILFAASRPWRKMRPVTVAPEFRHVALALVLVGAETLISFSYAWGKSLHPSACRLFIWLDTVAAFAAGWALTLAGRRLPLRMPALNTRSDFPATVLASAALFAMHVPVASEARFTNSLILTRQAAISWRFFGSLHTKDILILTDRPGLFTIMDYGAIDISSANFDRKPLLELSRHLYRDIYLVQEIDLNTGDPLPAFNAWPDVPKETVLEFQNTDSQSVRIARVKH